MQERARTLSDLAHEAAATWQLGHVSAKLAMTAGAPSPRLLRAGVMGSHVSERVLLSAQ
jgi:hypothetical protein